MNTPTQKTSPLTVLCWTGIFGMALTLSAQSETLSIASSEAARDTSFIELLRQGGWAMWPLGLFSMASLGLMIYNGLMIQPEKFLQPEVTEQINRAMMELEMDKARELCRQYPGPVTTIVDSGLSRIADRHIDMAQVDKALEESSAAELSGPFVLINYLSVIGAVAPMVGLLGTVSGMVKAFRAISHGGLGDPGVLANNISEALITTASGLVVAIPSLIAFYYFKNKYGKISSRVGKQVGDLFFNMMVAVRQST